MDCSTFQEYISAAVDGALDDKEKFALDEHVKKCHDCRNELELEQFTKNTLLRTIQRASAPAALTTSIVAQLLNEPSSVKAQSKKWEFMLPTWKTAFVFSGGLAAVVILFVVLSGLHHSHTNPIDGNIIHQTYNNFDSILDGDIKPQVVSDKPEVVQSFLASKANFNVHVPKLKRCSLVGGVFSQYKNEGIAHVIYKQNNDIIYIYQAQLGKVINEQTLQLSDQAKRDLLTTGWYFENHSPNCSLIIWTVDSTVCCAIADISRGNLLAYLTDTN